MPLIKSLVGKPEDSKRVDVHPAEMDPWYATLAERVDGIPRRFVFNVDKTGCSEHADSHEVRAVVPIEYLHPSVPVPVGRHSKRSRLTACVAADGHRMKPFLIVQRVTAEAELEH
jgi:hypothetical protein